MAHAKKGVAAVVVDYDAGPVLADCVAISKHTMAREYYKALMLCRKLIEYEDERLGNVAPSVSTGGAEG